MKNIYRFRLFLLFVVGFSILTCSNRSLNSANPAVPPPLSDIQLLEAIENAFVSIAERSKPAVVSITARNVTKKGFHPWTPEQKFDELNGTGFIFRKEGYILTNDHVVNGAKQIVIRTFDNREFKDAQLIGTDPSTDIAVLKIDAAAELMSIPLANSDRVRVGQFVIAIGNPFQLDYTVTMGIVSGKGRSLLPDSVDLIRYQDFIQTDAWINKGNSGGPLLNIYGEVIGINSLIRRADDVPATEAVRAGAGFAIPINMVKKISNQLMTNGRVIRGWLGIKMEEATDGIHVRQVFDSSPAKNGGVEAADVIIEYNGQRVRNTRELRFMIADSLVGEKVEMTVLRHGLEQKLVITIGEMPPKYTGMKSEPDSESWTKLGLAVRELGERDFERYAYLNPNDQGVIVEDVQIGLPAPQAGIPRGALISAINGLKIRNTQEYEQALKQALGAAEMTFEIKTAYHEEMETVTVKLEQK
jgi:S1-C subfamily serine protease